MVKTDVSCTDAVFEQSCFRGALERVSGVILTVRGHLFGGLGALLGHPCFRRSREVPPGVPRGTGWQITLGGADVKLWVSTPLPHPPRSSQGVGEPRENTRDRTSHTPVTR